MPARNPWTLFNLNESFTDLLMLEACKFIRNGLLLSYKPTILLEVEVCFFTEFAIFHRYFSRKLT